MKTTSSMRLPLISVIILFCSGNIAAQSFTENGLLFGRTTPGGSARVQALGGAQVALGGDFSSTLSNPAGLGMYNRSEVTLSMAVNTKNYNTRYFGTSTENTKSQFTIPGISVVLHFEPSLVPENSKGFLGGSLGISFTKINDLNSDYHYQGNNNKNSIIDHFKQDAHEIAPNNPDEMLYGGNAFYYLTALAYNNYLIDFDDNVDLYYSALDPLAGEVRTVKQYETINRKGNQYQWSIAYGANFSDKLFIGGNIGITTLKYKLEQSYSESDFTFSESPDYNPLDYFNLGESLDIEGSGVNLTLGLTYRPIDFLQLGAAFTTPTLYQVTDNYEAQAGAQWNDFDYYGDGSLILEDTYEEFGETVLSEYNLTTPLKIATGIAFLSKYGFITADFEFVNYGRAKYSSEIDGFDFDQENREIKSLYGRSLNFRTGIELRYSVFRLRAGYNLMEAPARVTSTLGKVTTISGGVGVRINKFFGDFALLNSKADNARIPYSGVDTTPVATQKLTTVTGMITIGYSF